jgi:hypothetical protein
MKHTLVVILIFFSVFTKSPIQIAFRPGGPNEVSSGHTGAPLVSPDNILIYPVFQ